jgi:hypothetical protein
MTGKNGGCAMPDVQLNVWIDKQYKDQLEQWKTHENKPGMNVIVEELIKAEMARRSGKVIEQESLPVIREIVRAEVREATAELRRELRLDRELEQTAQRDYLRKSFDRIAGLTIHAIRNAGFAHRYGYALLAKLVSIEFAQKAQEDSRKKIERELLPHQARNTEQHIS